MIRWTTVAALLLTVALLSGCSYAIVETDPIEILLPSAKAEEALVKGDRDTDGSTRIADLQQQLIDAGYLTGKADGIFGAKTQSALMAFQRSNDIPATGALDDETQSAFAALKTVPTPEEDVLYAAGDEGDDVQALQTALRRYGFLTAEPTGVFDEETEEAVEAFQRYAVKYYGTEFDAPLVLPSAPKLLSADAELPQATPAPQTLFTELVAPAPAATLKPEHATDGAVSADLYAYITDRRFPVFRTTVRNGDTGAEVLRLQKRLNTLGYYYGDFDSTFDDRTLAAVRCFQTRNGLQDTGIANSDTQTVLFSEGAVGLEEVDKPFLIRVSLDDQRVYVYRWDGEGYNYEVRSMICSTGAGTNDTPTGRFVSTGRRDSQWHYFIEHHCWAQYAFVISGNILFHSVLYSEKDESTLRTSSVRALGHKASHGCVRLQVVDAKWIYTHCSRGQVIEIY